MSGRRKKIIDTLLHTKALNIKVAL